MKRISIGTWAYTIGPYQNNPVPFETVVKKLRDLEFDGLELGAFNFHKDAHPNPVNCATPAEMEKVKGLMKDAGLEISGTTPATKCTSSTPWTAARRIWKSTASFSNLLIRWTSKSSASTRCRIPT